MIPGRHRIVRAAAAALATSVGVASADTALLSLNPYEAVIDGLSVQLGGNGGPLAFPDGGGTIGFAFTIPAEYAGGPAPRLHLLWESPTAQGCTFWLLPNALYRARNGRFQDAGGASAGLSAVDASTASTSNGEWISMAAPDPAGSVERVTYVIRPGPDEFGGPFKPGDAVTLSLYRNEHAELDSCSAPLVIDGASIEYEIEAPR